MLFHSNATRFLTIMAATLVIASCSSLQPVHEGKFVFSGKVTNEAGQPVPNAWVKIKGWETLTDQSGRWSMEQIVNCGALREHPTSYNENDQILIEAPGYKAVEELFIVRHPSYFQSCQAEQNLVFDTQLGLKPSTPQEPIMKKGKGTEI